ncbi:MAG TPA: efflux RND transporter periplasmic adaptor subunit [Candidatus Obscuribacterales bacterium]
MGIQVAPAQERVLDFVVETSGEVQANANLLTHVNAPVAGRVTEVLAQVGQHVTEGQPLLRIRSQDIGQSESDLLQNEGQVSADLKRDLLQVDSEINLAQAHLRLSESTYKRVSSLVEEKIASRADFETAKTHYEEDRLTLEALKRKRESIVALSQERMRLLTEPIKQKLRLLGVSETEIAKVLRSREINPLVPVVAPENGIVSERSINVGELTEPSKPLFTIADFHNVWLQAYIYEKDIARVAEGQPIVLELDSFPGEKFNGTLNYVADSLNPETRTLLVRAEVPNPGLKLKPKMFARMRIMVGRRRVLAIPKDAVQDAGSYKVVYVPAGTGRYEERKLELGGESGGFVEVAGGLAPGEKVVVKGTFELRSESLKAAD